MFNLDLVFLTVGIFISIAMVTLMERKIMSYIQNRKGPTKTILWGNSQPISDVIKLFSKSMNFFNFSIKLLYPISPILGTLIMSFLWISFPSWFSSFNSHMVFMLIISIMSLSSYFIFLSSYSSSSLFSFMGFIRTVSQTVSYEVAFMLFILLISYKFESMNIFMFSLWQSNLSMLWSFLPLLFMWMVLCMSESNRSPFDFSEGESELVSGFNTEFSSTLFSLMFMSEYGMLIFISFLGIMLLLGSGNLEVLTLAMLMIILWARCTFPRFRYDFLMSLSWKNIMPLTLFFIILVEEMIYSECMLNV